jgi:DNA-binding transcriptional MerR regulator/effector-binding domain-containing protein
MAVKLSIGDFSRMTHLSIKALRHYHDLGLLEPSDVDAQTGYRSYNTAQVPRAQIIRRFRGLGMPVEQVKAVLDAPDLATRNALIVAHLERMEYQLDRTQSIVSSLRALLAASAEPIAVEYRSVPRLRVAAISKVVELSNIEPWWSNSFAEIYRALRAAEIRPAAPSGGLYPTELFTEERADVVLFVPISDSFEPTGNVQVRELPAVELAVAIHHGALREADRTYGPLGTHVAERAIGVVGPIREHYLITEDDTAQESQLQTEIGWPIFRTAGSR